MNQGKLEYVCQARYVEYTVGFMEQSVFVELDGPTDLELAQHAPVDAFRFRRVTIYIATTDIGGKIIELRSGPEDTTPWVYLGGEVQTASQLELLGDAVGAEGVRLGKFAVIRTRFGLEVMPQGSEVLPV